VVRANELDAVIVDDGLAPFQRGEVEAAGINLVVAERSA
jgi:hypothetical protein